MSFPFAGDALGGDREREVYRHASPLTRCGKLEDKAATFTRHTGSIARGGGAVGVGCLH